MAIKPFTFFANPISKGEKTMLIRIYCEPTEDQWYCQVEGDKAKIEIIGPSDMTSYRSIEECLLDCVEELDYECERDDIAVEIDGDTSTYNASVDIDVPDNFEWLLA